MSKNIEKIIQDRKKYLRLLFYSFFIASIIDGMLMFDYGDFFDHMYVLLVMLIPFVAITELLVWILPKIFEKIHFFESKDELKQTTSKKKKRYAIQIKRYSIIVAVVMVVSIICFSFLPQPPFVVDIPHLELISHSLDILMLVSLLGVYKLRKWGWSLLVSINFLYLLLTLITSFRGLFVVPFMIGVILFILYFPYVRREIFE